MKFRKKPVVVEAFQYDGDLKDKDGNYYVPGWAETAFDRGILFYDSIESGQPPCELFINTLEAIVHILVGDFVIKGVKDELYPCKQDIFEATYEPVE